MLQQNIDVTMRGHKTMRPEWYPAFVEPLLNLIRCGLENAGSRDDHLVRTVDSAESRQPSFAHFADQLHREAARFTFSRDSVFRETSRTQLACQWRWTSPIPDDFHFLRLLI